MRRSFSPWQGLAARVSPRRAATHARVGTLIHLFAASEKSFMAVTLEALDLAALLCSRVCHDLISPAGAIVNGLEVLEEKDSDEETKTFALDLIKRSAKTASAR